MPAELVWRSRLNGSRICGLLRWVRPRLPTMGHRVAVAEHLLGSIPGGSKRGVEVVTFDSCREIVGRHPGRTRRTRVHRRDELANWARERRRAKGKGDHDAHLGS